MSERRESGKSIENFNSFNHSPLTIDYSRLQFTYPKEEHLKSRKAIEQLFKSGQSFFIYPYKVVYQIVGSPLAGAQNVVYDELTQNATVAKGVQDINFKNLSAFGHPQGVPLLSGFAVSTKNFKRAVDRNHIKRLGREAFRLHKHPLTLQLEASQQQLQVFFIFTDKKLPDFKLIEPKMQACLKKLGWLARQIP